MKNLSLITKLILGIISGIIVGIVSSTFSFYFPIKLLTTFSSIFGNFLKFMIPLVILGFVIPGIAELGKSAGKLLGITILISYISSISAGIGSFFIGSKLLPIVFKGSTFTEKNVISIDPFFNIEIQPIMGVMCALILAFIFGIGISNIKSSSLFEITQEFQSIVKLTVEKVLIPLIPIHIMSILAKLTATGKIFNIIASFSFVFVLIICLQILYILIQYLITFLITKKNIFCSIKNMLPAYFTALGTQSSAATIPITLECAKKNEVSDNVANFVVPLCATIHLAGDTITLVLGAMGIMMINNTTPTFAIIFPYILLLGITMVAAPGIPGGGVVAALGLLEKMLMFSADQQGLMIALHFSQDSFGTATNVTGDGAIALIINKIFKDKFNK